MGKLRWYKRDPVAALEGMSNLTLEERGAYNTVLDLIYARDGKVDDDDRFISGWLRCDLRVWRRIRNRLIEVGKLYVADGALRNSRADAEVDRGLSMVASASEAGKASARSRNDVKSKNKDIAATTVETTASTNSTTTTTSRTSSLRSDARARDWPPGAFEQFYERYPHKVGRAAAKRAFASATKTCSSLDHLMAGLDRYIASKPPDRSWCNPSTWLNQARWDDAPANIEPRALGPPGRERPMTAIELELLNSQRNGKPHDEPPEHRGADQGDFLDLEPNPPGPAH